MKYVSCLIILLLTSSNLLANQEDEAKVNPVLQIAFLEGLVILNSAMASQNPEAFGVLLTLISPLSASSESNQAANMITLGSMATLGLYNASELRGSEYSKNDVFQKNVLGWHALALTIGITSYFIDDVIDTNKILISQKDDGMVLSFGYDF